MHVRRKRHFDNGPQLSARRWMRELSSSAQVPLGTSETCRNADCDRPVAPGAVAHGFCESCWNSKVRVIPGDNLVDTGRKPAGPTVVAG